MVLQLIDTVFMHEMYSKVSSQINILNVICYKPITPTYLYIYFSCLKSLTYKEVKPIILLSVSNLNINEISKAHIILCCPVIII